MESHNIGFVLGLIAGEGCFTFSIWESDDMAIGLYFSPNFQLKMNDENLVEIVSDLTYGGFINESRDTSTWYVRGWENCKKFADELLSAISQDSLFLESEKFDAFNRWCYVIRNYEPPQNEDELRNILEEIQSVNDTELGYTVDEWVSRANI